VCSQCFLPISGPYLLLNGKYLHPRHYRCEECGIEFKGGDCYEFEGDLYCRVVCKVKLTIIISLIMCLLRNTYYN
jgi:hypothetical protein